MSSPQKNKRADECGPSPPRSEADWQHQVQPSAQPAVDTLPAGQKLAGINQKHVLPVEGNGQQVGPWQTPLPSGLLCGHLAALLVGTQGPEQDIFSALCWKSVKCNYPECRCGMDDLEAPHKLNFEASLKLH